MEEVKKVEKLGVEEIKNVVLAAVKLAELVDAMVDGFQLSDIVKLVEEARTVRPAIAAFKSGLLLPEIKDLDDAEKADLKAYMQDNLKLNEVNVQAAIDSAFGVIVDLSDLLKLMGKA